MEYFWQHYQESEALGQRSRSTLLINRRASPSSICRRPSHAPGQQIDLQHRREWEDSNYICVGTPTFIGEYVSESLRLSSSALKASGVPVIIGIKVP